MVKISGNTYPHRATIKGLGFRWDGLNKLWYAVHATPTAIEAVKDLRGVIVSVNGEETDTRTYKQKYGQCEDAPCCGCCGQGVY